MKNLIYCLLTMVLLTSCPKGDKVDNSENESIQDSQNTEITEADIEAIDILEFSLSVDGKKATEDWAPFQTMINEIDNLRTGDLSFFKQESSLVETHFGELKSSVPDTLKSKPIQARLLAFETKLYLLNNELNLQNFPKAKKIGATKEFLISYSNLLLQINKKLELDANINVQKSMQ